MAINVVADGIPSASALPLASTYLTSMNRGGFCSYLGITSGPLKIGPQDSLVDLTIPSKISSGLIQVLGVFDPKGRFCRQAGTLGSTYPMTASNDGSAILFEIGRSPVAFSGDTQAIITDSYSGLTVLSDRLARQADCENSLGKLLSGFSYTSASSSYTLNIPITANAPSVTGDDPTSYSVAPSLPAGLNFNVTTGRITGTPSALSSSGTYDVTVTNAYGSAHTSLTLAVVPPLATQLVIAGASTATRGVPYSLTVTAKDALGNVATGYTGTVALSSASDSQFTAPAAYVFQGSDLGVHTFTTATFGTAGTESIQAGDGTRNSSPLSVTVTTPSFGGVDNPASGFSGGTAAGILNQQGTALRIDTSNSPSGNSSLDISWTPQWGSLAYYWQMENNWTDAVNGNDMTAFNSAGFSTTSKIGAYSAAFNGSSSFARTNSPTASPLTTATVALWAKRSAAGSGYARLFDWNNDAFDIADIGSGDQIGLYGPFSWVGSGVPFGNGWNHIVVVITPQATDLYVNGVFVASYAGGVNLAAGTLTIGSTNGGETFNGLIDEVAVWSSALTPSEIAKIYGRQSSGYSGVFYSRVFDYGSAHPWSELSWKTPLPFGKELPDGAVSEVSSDYSAISSNLMSGNLGLWHLNETSGSTAADTSGNNNTGTILGGATLGVSSTFDKGITLNGSDAVVNVASNSSLNAFPLTIAFWVKTGNCAGQCGLVNKYVSGSANGYQLFMFGTEVHAWYFSNGSANAVYHSDQNAGQGLAVANVGDDQWHHLAYVVDFTGGSIYKDGVLANSEVWAGTPGPPSTTQPLSFGLYPGQNYLAGTLDEVSLWSRALTPSEILQLYRRGVNRIKFQVRSCASSPCNESSEPWAGPGASSTQFFSEIYNRAGNLLSGAVQAGFPDMIFSNFNLTPASRQYFQYRAFFQSDDLHSSCNYGSGQAPCSPELGSVTVVP